MDEGASLVGRPYVQSVATAWVVDINQERFGSRNTNWDLGATGPEIRPQSLRQEWAWTMRQGTGGLDESREKAGIGGTGAAAAQKFPWMDGWMYDEYMSEHETMNSARVASFDLASLVDCRLQDWVLLQFC